MAYNILYIHSNINEYINVLFVLNTSCPSVAVSLFSSSLSVLCCRESLFHLFYFVQMKCETVCYDKARTTYILLLT